MAVEPFLRRREAGKAGHRGGDIDRLPLRVESRDLKLVDAAEQMVDETADALVAVGSGRPVVRD